MTVTHESLIKVDRRGRLRYTAEQRASLLDAYDASGLSGPKFAALHGIKYQTFAAWRNKRGGPGVSLKLPAPGSSTFIEVEVPAACSGKGVAVLLPGGAKLHIANAASVPLAAALIRELSGPC